MLKRTLPPLCVWLAVTCLYLAGALEFFERRWMDLRFRLSRREASAGIVLVDIDPRSLQGLEVWPWPRGYHSTVLEELLAAGARRVGFDVDFSSRSTAEEDVDFATALEAARGRAVLPTFDQWQVNAAGERELLTVTPLPELRRHATLGCINVKPGPDGLVRSYGNRATLSGETFPGFATALAGDPRPDVESFFIDFGIAVATIPRISYIDVLTGSFDHATIAGKTVIVGSTAVELGDQIAVPVAAALAGPHLQALAYESLVQERLLRRSGPALTLAVGFLLAIVLFLALCVLSWRGGLLLLLLFLTIVAFVSVVVQALTPLILDSVPWLLTCVGVYGAALVSQIDRQALGLRSQRQSIRHTETLMRHVVENSFDAILTVSDDGIVETFNRAAQEMFDYTEDGVLGQPLGQFIYGDGLEAGGSMLARATAAPAEAAGRGRNGRTFPVEMVVTAIDTGGESKLVVFLRDITERKSHQRALEHQATHDPLTDLPNRFLLLDRIAGVLNAAGEGRSSVAILLLDLDRFKEINDALGHHTGDRLLQQVAKRLQMPLAPTDTIARLGGDEFAVLLPATDVERAKQLACTLIEALRTPFKVEGLSLQIDTSIGIAMYPEHGADAETLIQRADVAMYVAKRKRGGLCLYEPEQDYNSVRHLMLRGDLRDAIQGGLLSLAYQPKMSAATDEVIGVEALLRWKHPQHGMIPPDEFIGLAEHSGLIRPLTLWVIETALRQSAQWREEGLRLIVSVNLSARNLLEEDLPRNLERLLKAHGLTPDLLTLEITESMLMEEPDRSLEVITRLNELGLTISIDDFGTGYSSLGYLMRLPAREIKIDRTFVMRMDRDGNNATIVRSIIELAHNLKLEVVAEGVETLAVWSTLKQLGCDVGQGYYFSKPLPPAELLQWIEQRAAVASVPPPFEASLSRITAPGCAR